MYKYLKAMALAGGVALVTGCATTAATPENQVQKLAQERWDLVLAGNYVEAYEYYSPGYRSAVSLTDYIVEMKLRRVRWTGVEFEQISCTENVCNVRWKIFYEVYQPVPGLKKWSHFQFMEDDWILLKGQWWYVPPKADG